MNICIIGAGYVGLVSAACFAETGNNVCCVDIDPDIIKILNRGEIHIFEPGLKPMICRNLEEDRLRFTTQIADGIEDGFFLMNCVGTPSNDDGSCDLSYVFDAARQIGRHINEYKIIVNKSTVPVGTADAVKKIIGDEIAARGLNIEFDVVSNPEFLKEGDAVNDFLKPDRVIVGTDNVRTAKLLETLYAPFARSRDKMLVMGIRSAELTKYAANCMLAAKISYINEIANICELVGADIQDVRRGIGSDHRIGYSFIYPGVGYGGSCFPKDVKSLINTSLKNGYDPFMLSAVDKINTRQKSILAEKIISFFNQSGGVNDKTLALWGLAFKANTDDIREAPSLTIIKELTENGMKIQAYDPAAINRAKKELAENKNIKFVNEQYEALKGADALAVVTDWNQFRNPDFNRIKKALSLPVIFDGRNLYSSSLINSLGFTYFCIGKAPI